MSLGAQIRLRYIIQTFSSYPFVGYIRSPVIILSNNNQ